MGIKRIVDTGFWTDGKVDDFSPEDKYFMLYLLTNPFSTQLGIYEISIKQVAFQIGYSIDAVKVLIDRFENKYGVIIFSPETNEIAIKNYLYHSIVKGGAPVRDCLIKEMKAVKAKHLIADVFAHLQKKPTYEETANATVRNIVSEFWKSGIDIPYCNEKNDTGTNRERIVDESYHNENENENENENAILCQFVSAKDVINLYNSICKSLPAVRKLTTYRENVILETLKKISIEDFKSCFEKAEASSFLKGKNESGWQASFDWLIIEDNIVKVLEGNYADRPKRKGKQEIVPDWMKKRELDQDELAAINSLMEEEPAETDPDFQAQADEMQKKLQEKYGKKG